MKTIILVTILCVISVQVSNSQWVQINNGMGNRHIYSLAFNANTLFAGGSNAGVFFSTDNGANWTQTSLPSLTVWAIAVIGENIFAGTLGNGVYLSTNNGSNWTQSSLNNVSVQSLAVNGNNIFAGTSAGVYLSIDNGTTWTQTPLNNRDVWALAINGNNIFAGGYSNYGVYKSTDNGTSWTQTSLNNQTIWSLAISGNHIFAGGRYVSTDNGSTWTQTSLNFGAYSLAVNGNYVFAGAYLGGVYVSSNNGTSWAQRNEGMGNATVNALSIINNNIFSGTNNNSVYRRLLGELTGISSISSEIPSGFLLLQNYPNPFNPSTKIRFALPKSSFTKLIVYDALGRELETLVDEQLNAGTYEAVWASDKSSSGVYFYKLTSGEFSQTNKMLLLK